MHTDLREPVLDAGRTSLSKQGSLIQSLVNMCAASGWKEVFHLVDGICLSLGQIIL